MVPLALASFALATMPPARITLVGGTHGNEYTGVYVIQQLEPQLEALRLRHPSLRVETLLANPKAFYDNRRFVDDDLNRQFSRSRLGQEVKADAPYEVHRARDVVELLGPKGPKALCDMCIDLHTTTANMGCTLIVNSYCALALRVAAYLQSVWEHDVAGSSTPSSHPLRVYVHDVTQEEAPYLSSVAQAGITIEVGPTPQGLLRSDAVAATRRAVDLILHYLELHFDGRAPEPPCSLRAYVDKGKVPWPEAAGGSQLPGALVAASLQDRDFQPLCAGERMFERPDGSSVDYDGSCGPVAYPIFVNEAAYYYAQSGRGIVLTSLVDWPVE